MEPERFEEHIKKQLQRREIKPSADSWEKLEARLEQEEKPKRLPLWSIGVAAAIAGVFFFLGTLFHNPVEPEVVEQRSEEILPVEPIEKPKPEVLIASETAGKEDISDPEPLPEKMKVPTTIAAVVVQEEPLQNPIFKASEPGTFPDLQMEKVVAEGKPETVNVSEAEIDALLKAAMAELDENPSKYAVQPVDAQDLLNEVEYELELNFRQKIFEVLKEGFSKAKTAVANRNN